jgi:hypothetical protein
MVKMLEAHIKLFAKIEPDIKNIIEKMKLVNDIQSKDALYTLIIEKLSKEIQATAATKIVIFEILKYETINLAEEQIKKMVFNTPNYIG